MDGRFHHAKLRQLSLFAVLLLSCLVPMTTATARCYIAGAVASSLEEQRSEEQALTAKTAYTGVFDPFLKVQIGLLRWYDPNLQRWINRDPMGERGGLNLYRFNYNAPLTYVDPNGYNPIVIAIIAGAIWGAIFTPSTVNAPGPNDPIYPSLTGDQLMEGALLGAVTGGALGALDSALTPRVSIRPSPCPVSRWGRPGLQSGDWIMEGPPSKWNYRMSGKWEKTPFNQFAPFESGQMFEVPPDSIHWPPGWNFFRGLPPFNQRQYIGPSIPPSSGSIINAPPSGPFGGI